MRLLAAGSERCRAAGPPDRVLRYGPDPDQCVEISGPREGPRLVVLHGGFFRPGTDRAHARPMAGALAAAGYRVALAEYRRLPGRPEATIDDVRLLDAALHDDEAPAAAWIGHSAGGTLVLLRALQPDLAAVPVVALAPVADLRRAVALDLGKGAVVDWIGATPDAAPAAYDALDPRALVGRARRAGGLTPRLDDVHVVHGDLDATVPVELAEPLGLRMTRLARAHHLDLIDPESPAWPSVCRVIETVVEDSTGRRAGPRSLAE